MIVVVGVFVAFVVGWTWGKRTGFDDGRRAGHQEVVKKLTEFDAMRDSMNRHTFATPYGPCSLVPIQAAEKARDDLRALGVPVEVCGEKCDHGSECLLRPGHAGDHETQHGCLFPKD